MDNCIIRGNRVYGNLGSGISVGSGANNMAYNNLVHDNGTIGIVMGVNGPTTNALYNNTVYNNASDAIHVQYLSGTHYVRNNIMRGNGTDAIVFGPSSGGATIVDTNNVTADPNFVSTTPSSPDFLRINSASTAVVDLGYDLSGVVDTDYAGNARPYNSTYDVGAYEFTPVTELMSASATVTPSLATQYIPATGPGPSGSWAVWRRRVSGQQYINTM